MGHKNTFMMVTNVVYVKILVYFAFFSFASSIFLDTRSGVPVLMNSVDTGPNNYICLYKVRVALHIKYVCGYFWFSSILPGGAFIDEYEEKVGLETGVR